MTALQMGTVTSMGFSDGSAGKESPCSARDPGSIPGLGRSPGEGKGYPLQRSGLESSKDCVAHGVTKSWTRLSDFHFHFHGIGEEAGEMNGPVRAMQQVSPKALI